MEVAVVLILEYCRKFTAYQVRHASSVLLEKYGPDKYNLIDCFVVTLIVYLYHIRTIIRQHPSRLGSTKVK